jgi:hypothetical protein
MTMADVFSTLAGAMGKAPIPSSNDKWAGLEITQSGADIGGLAYVVLGAAVAFVVAPWLRQKPLVFLVAGFGTVTASYLAFLLWSMGGYFLGASRHNPGVSRRVMDFGRAVLKGRQPCSAYTP